MPPAVPAEAPGVRAEGHWRTIIAGEGDALPVSAMPVDGTFPTGTTQWEKRNIALEIPVWDPELCIQCGKCVAGLPARRASARRSTTPRCWPSAPATFKSVDGPLEGVQGAEVHAAGGAGGLHRLRAVRRGLPGQEQDRGEAQGHQHGAAAADPRAGARELGLLPDAARDWTAACSTSSQVKDVQLLQPLFEFSGACAGCGETPYVKLLTQLFGDRAVIANATGCSSIYGGNLPTTPYTRQRGRARAGLVQLAVRGQRRVRPGHAAGGRQAERVRPGAAAAAGGPARRRAGRRDCSSAEQTTEAGIAAQRERVAALKAKLAGDQRREARDLLARGRRAGQEERLDRRRRRLGLRHRLRRPGPRAGLGPQRQRPGAGHRGVLEHRRPDVEGDAARRGGQVRRRRQAAGQEGPGHDGHDLRQRLRGPGGDGRQRRADGAGRSWRPRPTTGRRSSSPTATASPTAST